ncbi:hypothetical protein M5E89_02365 [Acidaminococcus intestini]|nr:hypothetical protein M5E89_02365 [Acidaminococcus intestini]
MGLCLFALTLLPSALLSPDVSFSFGKYLNSIVGRIVVLPMLLFLDVDEKAIKKALLCFIAFIAFDGLCTFGERLITGADRAHGLGMGGCVMLVLLLPFFLQALSFGCKRRKRFPTGMGF